MDNEYQHRKRVEHIKERALDRHGIVLSDSDINHMNDQAKIRTSFVRDRNREETVRCVFVGGTMLYVIYNRFCGEITTILPKNSFEEVKDRDRDKRRSQNVVTMIQNRKARLRRNRKRNEKYSG